MKRLQSGMNDLWKKLFLITAMTVGGLLVGGDEARARISSPGNVTFSNPTGLTTTAVFDSSGTYVLQYAASDSVRTSTKTVTVTVNPILLSKVCVGATSGIAGNAVDLVVVLGTATVGLVGVQFDMTLPAGIVANTATPGPILTAAGKNLTTSMVGNVLKVLAFGINQTAIDSGLFATVNFQLAATLPSGPLPIVLANVVGSDAAGISVPMSSCNGTITVAANAAPVVGIGGSQTITLPATATLTATMTDDGAPNPPGALVGAWSVL